ncbi:hypothetical protein SCT_2140 [Sulfuricella sp. T08]|uniref:DUF3135 domain-containing protein n=1 Tax=Sulfuricella sp. T08 TaxID=1632857 RepID=UPI0006179CF1|nr:DUF3135 domain-containing protein [Sulfuricella sp. T08]GAO36730.1 hypothetical protein SCT_2140 [Sulfuricella sp. T08]
MNAPHMEPWDFDAWMALSRSDPTAFEERRRCVIEETIARAPQHMQPRLRALQWRIDMERARASNPLSACIRLYNMMWKSLNGENGLMSAIGRLTGSDPSAGEERIPHSARILPFEPHKRLS